MARFNALQYIKANPAVSGYGQNRNPNPIGYTEFGQAYDTVTGQFVTGGSALDEYFASTGNRNFDQAAYDKWEFTRMGINPDDPASVKNWIDTNMPGSTLSNDGVNVEVADNMLAGVHGEGFGLDNALLMAGMALVGGAGAWAGGLGGAAGAVGAEAGLAGGAFDMAGMGLELGSSLGAGVGAGTVAGGGLSLAEEIAGLGGIEGVAPIAPSSGTGLTGIVESFSPGSYNPADPLGLGTVDTGITATNLGTGVTPGGFTASQLPGGSLNTGLVDLGGAGGVLGAGSNPSTLQTILDTVTNLPSTPSMPPADTSGTNPNLVETQGTFNPAATSTGTAVTAGSALSRIIDGTATTADWLSALGTAGSTVLGSLQSNDLSDSLTEIANQSRADRQPFLDKANAMLAGGPEAYAAGDGAGALSGVLRGLSVNGNPFGNATSLALAGDATNRNYQNAMTGYANIGLSGSDSRNNTLTQAAQADGGVLTSLASGLGSLTQTQTQPQSLSDLLRKKLGTGGSVYVLP